MNLYKYAAGVEATELNATSVLCTTAQGWILQSDSTLLNSRRRTERNCSYFFQAKASKQKLLYSHRSLLKCCGVASWFWKLMRRIWLIPKRANQSTLHWKRIPSQLKSPWSFFARKRFNHSLEQLASWLLMINSALLQFRHRSHWLDQATLSRDCIIRWETRCSCCMTMISDECTLQICTSRKSYL